MAKGTRILLIVLTTLALLCGAFASAAIVKPRLAGANAVISSPGNGALFETGARISFDGSRSTGSPDMNGTYPIIAWDWTFGDGGTASGMKVSYTYDRAGSFTVDLTVTDSVQASGSTTIKIVLAPPAQPQDIVNQPNGGGNGFNPMSGGMVPLKLAGASAVISSPTNNALFETGDGVLFDGSRSTGSGNMNQTYPVVSWEWDFGDGSTGSGTTIVHSFSSAGSYTVGLTVTDSIGASASSRITVCISPPARPQDIPSQPTGGSNFNPFSGGTGSI